MFYIDISLDYDGNLQLVLPPMVVVVLLIFLLLGIWTVIHNTALVTVFVQLLVQMFFRWIRWSLWVAATPFRVVPGLIRRFLEVINTPEKSSILLTLLIGRFIFLVMNVDTDRVDELWFLLWMMAIVAVRTVYLIHWGEGTNIKTQRTPSESDLDDDNNNSNKNINKNKNNNNNNNDKDEGPRHTTVTDWWVEDQDVPTGHIEINSNVNSAECAIDWWMGMDLS